MVERPPVGALSQKLAIETSDNFRQGQHLTATKNCPADPFTHNSEGKNGCFKPLNIGVMCDAATMTRQNCWFH